MKKISISLLGVILGAALLAACGAAPAETEAFGGSVDFMSRAMPEEAAWNDVAPAAAPAPDMAMEPMVEFEMDANLADPGFSMPVKDEGGGGAGIMLLPAPVKENLAEKIIYSYYADIETLRFDETLAELEKLMAAHEAFVEYSTVSGINYDAIQRGWQSYRHAHYSIRVPVEHLNAVTAKLGSLGNVVNQSSNAENITSQFIDTESRLNSLRVQEERLLDMLKKAEDVSDLITIESSLADVRYQIESLTTTLNHWQRQVDYSTLTLNISEVEEYKEIVPTHRTYWERMGDGIISTLGNVGDFFAELFLWLVVSIPVLIILAAITVVIVIIVRRRIRKAKEKRKLARGEEIDK